MVKSRVEAFSDGVMAIIITIMVLEFRTPIGDNWSAITPMLPKFLSYVLSFVFIGIYWNNHHHMLHMTRSVNGLILWANLHLLFWLSLVPFVTGWMGENNFAQFPTGAYGVVLLMAGMAYFALQTAIIRHQGPGSELAAAVGKDLKGKISPAIYAVAVASSYWSQWPALALYALTAVIWIVPDRRIESRLAGE